MSPRSFLYGNKNARFAMMITTMEMKNSSNIVIRHLSFTNVNEECGESAPDKFMTLVNCVSLLCMVMEVL